MMKEAKFIKSVKADEEDDEDEEEQEDEEDEYEEEVKVKPKEKEKPKKRTNEYTLIQIPTQHAVTIQTPDGQTMNHELGVMGVLLEILNKVDRLEKSMIG